MTRVVPASFHDFFLGSASGAAALVGLLFVAISVAPHPVVGSQAALGHQVRASMALSALLSPLILSLVALIPGANEGWAALAVGAGGLLYVAATAARGLRARPAGQLKGAWTVLAGLLVLSGFFVFYGGRLVIRSSDLGALTGVAACSIASLSVGVNRAWALVGARSESVSRNVRDLLGLSPDEREQSTPETPTHR